MAPYLVALWVILLATDSFQELLLIQRPINYGEKPTRNLSCLTEDDGSALASITDPPTAHWYTYPKNTPLCYYANVKSCNYIDYRKRDSIGDWKVVSSIRYPMGPVFDYRWEEFTEVFPTTEDEFTYWQVGTFSSDGTIIFSFRGLGAVEVLLCRLKYSQCEYCLFRLTEISEVTNSPQDYPGGEAYAEPNRPFISEYEWQTFIFEWNSDEMRIRAHGSNVSLTKKRPVAWFKENYIFVKSSQPGHVRFHFYNYLLTTNPNAKLYMDISDHQEQNLCIELLVSLCSKCEMIVSVMNSDGDHISEIRSIYGREKPESDKLPAWHLEKLYTTVPHEHLPNIKLKISTQMGQDAPKGVEPRWAIHYSRKCPSAGAVRVSSTVTIGEQNGSSYVFPVASCQKFSSTGDSVVTMETSKAHNISSSLQKCLRENVSEFCQYQRSFWGRGASICEKSGCTCTPGLTGSDCNEECSNGSYGYDCRESCNHCKNKACTNTTGLCRGDCADHYLPPYCRTKLEPPNVSNVEGTTAVLRLNYSAELDVEEIRDLHFQLKTGQQDWTIPETKLQNLSTFEATICGLVPGTRYTVRAVMQALTTYGFWAYFESPEKDFDATSSAELTDVDLAPCPTGSCNKYNECSEHLEDSSRSQNQAPRNPQNFRVISQGKGVVTLMWHHTGHFCTHIVQFNVTIFMVNSTLQEAPPYENQMSKIHQLPPNQQECTSNMTLHLLTSTLYNFSITAINNFRVSKPAIASYRTPASVGFGSGETLMVERKGNFITLKIPTVVNATQYSHGKVIVKGRPALPCEYQNISADLRKLVNMTEDEAGWISTKIIFARDWPEDLTIGEDSTNNSSEFCTLNPKETYVVVLVLDEQVCISAIATPSLIAAVGVKQREPNQQPTEPVDSPGGSNSWIVFLLIFLICGVPIFIWRRKLWTAFRRMRPRNLVSYSEALTDIVKSMSIWTTQQPLPSVVSTDRELFEIISTPGVVAWSRYSHPVEIEDFEDYARESIANGLLKSQFKMFPRGPIKPHTYGSLPQNKQKNRYMNIIAYDDTRVILNKNPDDPYSDYINANYVQGFRNKNGYIAAQGPRPQTVADFWRMIWQEDSRIICMLTNVIDGEKVKCTQYWPQFGVSSTYGEIVVVTEKHDVFTDYTLRTFRVSCKTESRKIEHLHYTGWPDHAVPMFSNSVIAYLKRLQAIPVQNGPIIVHCSAGIGRTGTIILCDICLRQALTNGTVDVLAQFKKLRDCRMNMVDNELQYIFVHIVLTECFVSQPTELQCNVDLPQAIEKLKRNLPECMERLRNIAWQDEALHPQLFLRTPLPEQLAKNRFPELAPVSSAPVYLTRYPVQDTHSDYISAITVDGARAKKQYVASQLPLPSTLSDLWRLIAEQRIELIIILQHPDPSDPTCCEIIPDEEPLNPVPFINVELKARSGPEKPSRIVELLLTDTSKTSPRTQPVTALTCTGWGPGKDGKPPLPYDLVEFWMASENIHRAESPTLVLCHDGVTGCGLYLALSFLLERMAVERECDIIFAVRAIRRSRAEYVQSQEQLAYLCDAAVQYFKSFETYANFA